MTPVGHQQEQPVVFRRRRFAAPRRQRRLWLRLLKPLGAAMAIVGLPAAATVWAATSPVFRVDEVVISSAGRVSPELVRERLRALEGRHILMLRLTEVESVVGREAWLRGVEISKRLPSRLEVRLLERRSVALLRTGEGLFFLDRHGEVIAPYESGSGHGDYVLVVADRSEREAVREALALAEGWVRVAGPWAEGLSEIEIVDALSFRIHAADLDFPLLVTRENLEPGLRALQRYLPKINRSWPDLAVADLRFSQQIVFQPARQTPMEG